MISSIRPCTSSLPFNMCRRQCSAPVLKYCTIMYKIMSCCPMIPLHFQMPIKSKLKPVLGRYIDFNTVIPRKSVWSKLGAKLLTKVISKPKNTEYQTSFPPKLRVIWVWSWVLCAYPKTSTCCICTESRWNELPQEQGAYTNFQQCWVGLRFFRDPPGLGFRRFYDTRLSSFIIIIILQWTQGGFQKIECKNNSLRFQIVDSQTVYTSQFSKAALTQWVSKVLLFWKLNFLF